MSADSFAPLCIGQTVKAVESVHTPGLPVLEAASWRDRVTTGTVSTLRRVESGALVGITPPDCAEHVVHVSASWHGLRLSNHGFGLEIIKPAPEQCGLWRAA